MLVELRDVRPILERMDAFLLSSTAEGFSNVALEAMSMGKAVLLSDTYSLREMVQHGVNGYIYKAGHTDEDRSPIGKLTAGPEARAALGKRTRDTVSEKFSYSRIIVGYE